MNKTQAPDLPAIQNWTQADWDYIALMAQLRIAAWCCALYEAQAADPSNLDVHHPAANLEEALRREKILRARVRAAETLAKIQGRTLPDYDAYRSHWP